MNAPQCIVLLWWGGYIAINFACHGKKYERTASGFVAMGNVAINAAILWWGGFWS